MTLGMVSPQFSYLENGKEYLKWESVSFWGYKEITKGVCLACDRYHINVSPFFPHFAGHLQRLNLLFVFRVSSKIVWRKDKIFAKKPIFKRDTVMAMGDDEVSK